MKCVCRFNPITDIRQTVPGQSIDIVESIKTGTVGTTAKESFSNALDEIDKVGKRVKDTFDALEAQGILAKSIMDIQSNPEGEAE